MTQNAIPTKWKCVVAYQDLETGELSGALGQTDTEEECQAWMEDETQLHRSRGRIVVNLAAAEVCAECEGEGKIPAGNSGQVICQSCRGHLGPILPLVRLQI
jgi:DnaJ-class molecular chaperone